MSGAVGESFATGGKDGIVPDVWFLQFALASGCTRGIRPGPYGETGYARTREFRRVNDVPIRTPLDAHANKINFDGLFPMIPTAARTSLGPRALDELDSARPKRVAFDVKRIGFDPVHDRLLRPERRARLQPTDKARSIASMPRAARWSSPAA